MVYDAYHYSIHAVYEPTYDNIMIFLLLYERFSRMGQINMIDMVYDIYGHISGPFGIDGPYSIWAGSWGLNQLNQAPQG